MKCSVALSILCDWEVLSSNVNQETGCPDSILLCFSVTGRFFVIGKDH